MCPQVAACSRALDEGSHGPKRAAAFLWPPDEIRYRKTESSAAKDVCENVLAGTCSDQDTSTGEYAVVDALFWRDMETKKKSDSLNAVKKKYN